MALTRISGVAATSKSWKGEGSGDYGELEPVEGRPTEMQQGSEKATRPRRSGKGRASRR